MEFVHLDSEAFKNLKKQLDRIEREIRKLRDPVQVVSSEWLTIDEAAQVLRVTKRTVFKYIKNGELHRFDIVSSLHRQSSSRLLAHFCANLSNRVQTLSNLPSLSFGMAKRGICSLIVTPGLGG